jgi:phospholipid/cholesterol/gamma-HCH transport system substrate-binding protein
MKLLTRGRRRRARSTTAIGLIVIAVVGLAGVAAFQKDRITSFLSPGDTITAEFSRQYKLIDYKSVVKLADVRVGEVTGAVESDHGTTLVSMRVDPGIRAKLGSEPSAEVRPTLVVGGIYYVSLVPGGRGTDFPDGATIPVERTTVPVELDQVLSTLTPPAQQGVRSSVRQLDGTLANGGQQQVKDLLAKAPATLVPAGDVLGAARGTQPGTDLPDLVVGLENTAAALNRTNGQFASILDSLATTTGALAAEREPLAQTIQTAPDTLRATRDGLTDLQPTLRALTETAPAFRPAAQALDPLLTELDPVLVRARPVVDDLNSLLGDAQPLVERLVPTAGKATRALGDVRGPVLDRINGPVRDAVLSPWKGTGVYAGGGDDHLFYQELAYLASAGDDVFKFKNQQGGVGRLMAGVGLSTLTGGASSPQSLEQYLEGLGLQQPLGPQDGSRAASGGVPGLSPLLPSQRGGTR